MKKILFFLFCIAGLSFIFGCQKDKAIPVYNAKIRIDSLKQDSVLFAHQYYIKGIVKVYYTVINNDDIVLNSYRYTITAISCDSSFYQISETHYHTVPAKSQISDSTKLGIGNCKVAYANVGNYLFE